MMKSLKVLAFSLATLLPALGRAGVISGSFDKALRTAESGNPLSADRLDLPELSDVRYSIEVLDSCKARCDLSEMSECKERLEEFQVVAKCGNPKERGARLDAVGNRRDCAVGERLLAFLMKPRKDGTVIVKATYFFDDKADGALEAANKLMQMGLLNPSIAAEIEAREVAELQQLQEQLAAADRRVAAAHRRVVAANEALVDAAVEYVMGLDLSGGSHE